MHLLVVEDERALCETIVRSLRRLAYSVDCCYDGEKALELIGVEKYDLILLDLNMPGKDGMAVLRTLRQTDRETKVLILSARSEVEDKVEGLDAGANDYLAKPFHLAELEARIRSLTLRQFTQQDVLLTCGGLSFDTRSRTAAVNGQALPLTRKETGIFLFSHPQILIHRGSADPAHPCQLAYIHLPFRISRIVLPEYGGDVRLAAFSSPNLPPLSLGVRHSAFYPCPDEGQFQLRKNGAHLDKGLAHGVNLPVAAVHGDAAHNHQPQSLCFDGMDDFA